VAISKIESNGEVAVITINMLNNLNWPISSSQG